MSERYRGRLVDPRAYELADGSGWTAEVYVAEDVDEETIDTQFILKNTFPGREAALAAAIAAGKREVDKRVEHSEISSIIDAESRLPSTHRRGFSPGTDDLAEGVDGSPTRVPSPDNPEDRFD